MTRAQKKLIATLIAAVSLSLASCAALPENSIPRRVLDAVTTTTLEILGTIPTQEQ